MPSSKRPSSSKSSMDRKSFMLGMITAFAECIAGEAKKMAFSPPFYREDYKSLCREAEKICQEQGIFVWHEENEDLPEGSRLQWLVLFKFPEVLKEYKKLRRKGFNPALHFEKFLVLLSYGSAWGRNRQGRAPDERKKACSRHGSQGSPQARRLADKKRRKSRHPATRTAGKRDGG